MHKYITANVVIFYILIFSVCFAAEPLSNPKFQAFDSNGNPLSGGKVYTFKTGATRNKTTYTDYNSATPNANQVVLDSIGESNIFVENRTKLIRETSADVTVRTIKDINVNDTSLLAHYVSDYLDLEAAVNAIGSTEALLWINEDAVIADSGSITIPATLQLKFNIGATINGTSGGGTERLTVYSPENILAGDRQQIFGSNLSVTFSKPGAIYANWWDDGIDDGSTVADPVFDTAIGAAVNGSEIVVLPAKTYYNFASALRIDKSIHFHGIETQGADIRQATGNTAGIIVTVDNVEIDHIKLTGPQESTNQTSENAIYAYGADSSNYISNIKVHDTYITSWGNYGIELRFLENFIVENNYVEECFSAGIVGLSVTDGKIMKNIVDSIDGDGSTAGGGIGGVYGIQLSKNNGDAVRYPTSKRVEVIGNTVSNCKVWEGFDTHAGVGIKFIGNNSIDNMLGIVVTRYSSGGLDIGPEDCAVIGNTIRNENIATDTVRTGIQLVGAYTDYGFNNIVSNNIIYGHGDSDGGTDIGTSIYVLAQNNATISNNTINNTGYYGIAADYIGNNIKIDNNNLYGATSASGTGMYFRAHGGAATGNVANNTLYDFATGFYMYDANYLRFSNNSFETITTHYDQYGGTYALEHAKATVTPIATGTDTWDPGSIADGASESHIILNIPGVSALSSAHVSFNRELEGLVPHIVTGNTDTNEGTITITLTNETGVAIDIASLDIRYVVHKFN